MTARVATRPRLGFVGAGWIGRRRLDALARADLADVAAVADPAVPGCLDSLEELLELDLDGVVIATPSALHAEQALAALERGLAVFCQKPLALNPRDAERVVAAARRADALLAVDLSYRHTEAARQVRAATAEIGRVFAAELAFHNAYGPDKAWYRDPELAGGGCVLDLGIHLIDLALWTLDWPAVADVRSHLVGRPLEHYATAELDLEGGVAVRIACSWWLHAGRDCVLDVSFHGEEGSAALRNVDGSFYDFVAERYRGTAVETLSSPPDDWGGAALLDWTHRLAAGERFDPACERLVELSRVLDRIYEVAR